MALGPDARVGGSPGSESMRQANASPESVPEGHVGVVVNGEERTLASGTTITGLIAELGLRPDQVAVELDRHIVARGDWDGAELKRGASLEVVQFVGGG